MAYLHSYRTLSVLVLYSLCICYHRWSNK